MINLFSAELESLSVHRVGNKSRSEELFLSDAPYRLNDEITVLLKEYFFKPFRDKEESYFRFEHDVHLDYHNLQPLISASFSYGEIMKDLPGQEQFHAISKKIAHLLYQEHQHPHIKSGELYVAYISGVSIDNQKCDAIGIFKSEIKEDFLQFKEEDSHLELLLQQGVNLGKLDKGCLIFNVHAEEGYKVMTIDSYKYDAKYWLSNFLGLDIFEDEHYQTKKYMKFVQDFAKEVVLPAEDKKEEVMFLNRSANYFAKNENFEETNFLNEVLDNPDLIPEFKNYKVEKAPKYSIEDLTSFPISNSAANDARKKFKNVIKLDTGITMKLDFINPESAEKFLEKGWDEEKQMYYYLAYFNKEQA